MKDLDRLELSKREQKLITSLESQYRASVLKALQQIYTTDRVRDLNVKIFDGYVQERRSRPRNSTRSRSKPDNPDTPYDDSELAKSITRSSIFLFDQVARHRLQPGGALQAC